MIGTLLLRLEPDLSLDGADELTREVFLVLLEGAGRRRRRRGAIHDQLRGIVIERVRKARRVSLLRTWWTERITLQTPTEQDLADSAPSTSQGGAAKLTAVVSGLPRAQRELLILNVVEGMSITAIAQALRRPKGAVRRSLRASRSALWQTRSTAQVALADSPECGGWNAFIDGDLPAVEATDFQTHSRNCDHCGPAPLEWWRLHAELKMAAADRTARRPSPSQSREVAAMLLGRAYERKKNRTRRWLWAIVSVPALAALYSAWSMGWLNSV